MTFKRWKVLEEDQWKRTVVGSLKGRMRMSRMRQYPFCIVLGIVLLSSADQVVAADTSCLRAQDEMWIVSTRGVSPCQCPKSDEFSVRRFADGQWNETSINDLWAASDAVTAVVVHGNRINPCWAKRHGWMIYRKLSSGADSDERIRFVIWSWPSERIPGPIRDARAKAQRATSEGLLFGWFLGQFSPDNRLSLIGYSYGARVIGGGLHVTGGGSLNGQLLPKPVATQSVHVSLLAAAVHQDELLKNGKFAEAQHQMGELLLFVNRSDPILRRYYLLDKNNRQDALGFSGFCRQRFAPVVQQVNVSPYIGRSHDIQRYFSNHKLVSLVRDNVLWRSDASAKDACR
jgi:hypothetical protein